MDTAKLTLCDGRAQIKEALEAMAPGFPFALASYFHRAPAREDSVIWGEWSNTGTDCPVVDELCYAVTVRTGDLDKLRKLCQCVNEALVGIGLRRVYTSPDEFDDDQYTKTLRFGRRVDKRTMRLVD